MDAGIDGVAIPARPIANAPVGSIGGSENAVGRRSESWGDKRTYRPDPATSHRENRLAGVREDVLGRFLQHFGGAFDHRLPGDDDEVGADGVGGV